MNPRILLAAILVAILGLIVINKADARETEVPEYVVTHLNGTTANSVLDQLTPEQAKGLDDHSWYFWAKRHNELEYRRAAASRRPGRILLNVTKSNAEARGNIPGSNWYGDRGGDFNSRLNTRTESRVFHERTGGLPATIYNPYCR